MKKKLYCPACGTRELTKLFITTHKGKSLSLHLSSQAIQLALRDKLTKAHARTNFGKERILGIEIFFPDNQ